MSSDSPAAIVTGGAQGLGLAIVRVLLDAGYKVCIADINEEKAKDVLRDLKQKYGKGNVIFNHCDVSKEYDIERAFERSVHEFQRVDVLVNNAGIAIERNPRKTVEVNLLGTIYGCQAAIKVMSKEEGGKGGFVINIASIAGLVPTHHIPVYVATKHGVVGLTRSYGHPIWFEKTGVTFVALCPSFIRTEMLSKAPDEFKNRPDISEPSEIAQNVIKVIEDKKNGGILRIEKNVEPKYVSFYEEMETEL